MTLDSQISNNFNHIIFATVLKNITITLQVLSYHPIIFKQRISFSILVVDDEELIHFIATLKEGLDFALAKYTLLNVPVNKSLIDYFRGT